jgi:hypothetical protein
MYADYAKGADYVGYDIYPKNLVKGPCTQRLECVADGLDNLRRASEKPLFMVLGTGPLHNASLGPTPEELHAEAWMSIIHGATELVYFCHTWSLPGGKMDEAYLLHNPPMLAAVSELNARITPLARVIKGADTPGVNVTTDSVPVSVLAKSDGSSLYLFAAAMRDEAARATFRIPAGTSAEVLWENRTIPISDGSFIDDFKAYGVHVYKIGLDAFV